MAETKYAVITPPEVEPVSLNDAKIHLRMIPDDNTEDAAIIRPIISAAREYCENITGRALAKQTIAAYPRAGTTAVYLPRPPIISVASVTAYKKDGTAETLDPSFYDVDLIDGAVIMKTQPSNMREVNPLKIVYDAGFTKLPSLIRQAMLLLIGHWYENRESVIVGAIANIEVKQTTTALLNQYKDWWF